MKRIQIIDIDNNTTFEYLISRLVAYKENLENYILGKNDFIENFPGKSILYDENGLLKDFDSYCGQLLENDYNNLKQIEDNINYFDTNIKYIEKILNERKKWL